jgi:hypothetical protein
MPHMKSSWEDSTVAAAVEQIEEGRLAVSGAYDLLRTDQLASSGSIEGVEEDRQVLMLLAAANALLGQAVSGLGGAPSSS